MKFGSFWRGVAAVGLGLAGLDATRAAQSASAVRAVMLLFLALHPCCLAVGAVAAYAFPLRGLRLEQVSSKLGIVLNAANTERAVESPDSGPASAKRRATV